MKPQQDIKLYKTDGDTDPFSLILSYKDGGSVCFVGSPQTATMYVDKTSSVISISGIEQTNGRFLFPSSGVNGNGIYNFEVKMNDGTYTYTLGEGTITVYDSLV